MTGGPPARGRTDGGVRTSAAQIRGYAGPALLGHCVRPFFLFAGAWSALAMALWLAMLAGVATVPTALSPADWHAHELLFGYLPAAAAGFLLTAVPNWSGRLPVTGRRLLVLFLPWLAGRMIMLVSARVGPVAAALVDLLFLATLAGVLGREILTGRDWRNFKVLGLVALLLAGNAAFHVEAGRGGAAVSGLATRMGIATAMFMILLIGGRLVPSFTRNWLARRGPGRLPARHGPFDLVALAVAGMALASWTVRPQSPAAVVLGLVAGGAHAWRLARWAGERAWAEPMVWILHAGYGFVPVGFILVAAAAVWPGFIAQGAALHAWTAGGIGVMTLAVMTRASLSQAGREPRATRAILAIFVLAIGAAVVRVAAGLGLAPEVMLYLAAALWIAAFIGFTAVLGPVLWRTRR